MSKEKKKTISVNARITKLRIFYYIKFGLYISISDNKTIDLFVYKNKHKQTYVDMLHTIYDLV